MSDEDQKKFITVPSQPVSATVTYLGDGLYAEDQDYQFRLYASNGIEVSNEVFLDIDMIRKLARIAGVTEP